MTRTRIWPALVIVSVMCAAPSAHAGVQTSGPEEYPGKFAVGVHPLGFQVPFESRATGGYKLDVDFAANVKQLDKLTIWIGGQLGYAHPSFSCGAVVVEGCGHDIEIGAFVRLSLERLLRIPLVPYVEAGIGGDILAYPSSVIGNGNGSNLGGAFSLRVGGGIHYYLLKQLAVGAETHFAFGPGIYPNQATGRFFCGSGNNSCIGFFGYWDFLLGARFHF